jgi:glycosyltransferase involved in cell wall biosynthesis
MTAPSPNRRVAVLTHFPSPYQVELFNEIDRQQPATLKVFYLFRRLASRQWKGVLPTHDHVYLDDSPMPAGIADELRDAAFVVFNYYNSARAAQLIRVRAATGRPWCFWGERPGYRYPWLARLARLGRLTALRAGDQPIWGIGSWAVESYRQEFGSARAYLNLPYYSNLDRFQCARPVFSNHLTFLYSGVLTHRKGVDLLAGAFARLAAHDPRVRLKIMGAGEMAPRLRKILGASDRVEWVGFKDWHELPAVYASAHVLCVPSRHDGWGLVVPEGLAAGLPTIATDRTGAAIDLIAHRKNGWIVRAGDEDALFNAMQAAAALDTSRWTAMSDCARTRVAGHTLAAGAARFLDGVRSATPCAEVRA